MENVKAKKQLGQHFLKDENIARKTVESLQANSGNVLEVGAGMGVLTKYLLADERINLRVVEIDKESVEYLNIHYPQLTEHLISADFLRQDLTKLFNGENLSVIGNFPYNISSQILFKIVDNRNYVEEMLGMFQKEVADRVIAQPGSKVYGIVSVLVQAFYDVKYLFTVSNAVFSPPPKVTSAVIQLRRNQTVQLSCDESLFKAIVKTAFNQRRKMLRSSLKSFMIDEAKLPENRLTMRPEQLSVADFIQLTNAVIK